MRWILLLTMILGACNGDATSEPASGVSREQFVNVYVELGRAQRGAASSAEFQHRKEEILRNHSVTEQQLQAFVNEHGQQLKFMAEVWDSVRAQLVNDTIPQ